MYTYGYIVDAVLAKMDMTRQYAQMNGLLDKVSYYANECMTQICSAIKPKRSFAQFVAVDKTYILNKLRFEHSDVDFKFLSWSWEKVRDDCDEWHQQCWKEYHSLTPLNIVTKMPTDFISFGDEQNLKTIVNTYDERETVPSTDEDLLIRGYNLVMFLNPGIYYVSYNARWYTFDNNTDYDCEIDVPEDILDCLPSYIASQLFKIDDETKAQVYRNEYEQFLSRIDDDHYMNNKTIHITGDW